MLELIENSINHFELIRDKSLFCRISLGDTKIDWGRCKQINFLPFSYVLFFYNDLKKIDDLFEKFNIREHLSCQFINQLKDSIYSDELQKYNAIQGAISELLVADYFSINEQVVGLEARGEAPVDLETKNKSTNINCYTEVKYLGNIPELYEYVKNQCERGVNVFSTWLPNCLTVLTYVNMRIVDAIRQLKRKSLNLPDKKRVFILIDFPVINLDKVVSAIKTGVNWDKDILSSLCNKFSINSLDYLEKDIIEWHNEIDHLFVAHLDKSYNIDVRLNK